MGRQPKKSTAPVLRRALADGLAAAWPTESAAGQAGGHAISLRHHEKTVPPPQQQRAGSPCLDAALLRRTAGPTTHCPEPEYTWLAALSLRKTGLAARASPPATTAPPMQAAAGWCR